MSLIDQGAFPRADALLAAGKTWGLSGPDFLKLYLLFLAAAVLAGVVLRRRVAHGGKETVALTPPGTELPPPAAAMLFEDRRAVLSALALLRGRDLIDSAARPTRTPTAQDRQRLDRFSAAVLDRLVAGGRPTVGSLTVGARAELGQLRQDMVERGYFPNEEFRRGLKEAGLPVLLLETVGLIRVIAGLANGNPVGFLVAILVGQVLCYYLIVRTPRLTALGELAKRNVAAQHRHLRPANAPAFATYGLDSAAFAAAVFGGAALLTLDPGLANAVNPPGSSGGGYSGGDSGGDSSSSDGGGCGSSCGGGCGGGCGG